MPWEQPKETEKRPKKKKERKKKAPGVKDVAQWLTNRTRNHEVAGSVNAIDQRVKDPALT